METVDDVADEENAEVHTIEVRELLQFNREDNAEKNGQESEDDQCAERKENDSSVERRRVGSLPNSLGDVVVDGSDAEYFENFLDLGILLADEVHQKNEIPVREKPPAAIRDQPSFTHGIKKTKSMNMTMVITSADPDSEINVDLAHSLT